MPNPKREIDWGRVERVMRRSITGAARAEGDALALCQLALSADPERYRAAHHRIYNEEVALLRKAFQG